MTPLRSFTVILHLLSCIVGSSYKTDKEHVLPLEPLYKGATPKAVINLSLTEAQDLDASNQVWLIQFYAHWCDVCKEMAPLYNQVAQALEGIVKVGAVNLGPEEEQEGTAASLEANKLADKYKINEYPHIMLFGPSPPLVYEKPSKDLQSLIQFVMDGVVQTITARVNGPGAVPPKHKTSSNSSSKVVHLNQSNIANLVYQDTKHVWMVAFVAPWCGHCKALLPDWHAASRKLDGHGVKLGIVDATVETQLAQQYGVQGYPTIKVFAGESKSARKAVNYEFGRTTEQIVAAGLHFVEQNGGYTKEILELTSESILQETCNQAQKLCLLVALPHILESGATGRTKYIELMQQVTKLVLSTSSAPFDFLWFEGANQQLDLEQQLELTFGYPAVAAVSLEKGAYAIHRGSFSLDKLKDFINRILSGRQRVTPLSSQQLPVVTTEPWDGVSEGTPPQEDDLADIMGDDWQTDL